MKLLAQIAATMIRPIILSTLVVAFAVMPALAGTNEPSSVASALVEYKEFDRMVIAEGVVEAVRQSTLAAQVPGRVVALNVKAGDSVRAGQVLVQIDGRAAAQAEAASQSQVREARANLANAKAKFERSELLLARKFISQAALDQARAEYLAAQEQTAAAIANAGRAATSASLTVIAAPYAGVIAATEVEVGDMATPGRALVTLFDPRELRVAATLPQAVLGQAHVDTAITIGSLRSRARSRRSARRCSRSRIPAPTPRVCGLRCLKQRASCPASTRVRCSCPGACVRSRSRRPPWCGEAS